MAYPGRLLGRDIDQLRREMDRLFHDIAPASGGSGGDADSEQAVWSPRADLAETEDAFLLSLDVPGVAESDLHLTIEDDTLKVAGERRFAGEASDSQYHRIERSYGRFYRAFRFGSPIDPAGVTADFEAGVLNVRVPKSEASKPRRIEVRQRSARPTGPDGEAGG